MAYNEENVWQDEIVIKILIEKSNGSREMKDNGYELLEGETLIASYDAIKKEHHTEIVEGNAVSIFDQDETWKSIYQPEASEAIKMAEIKCVRDKLLRDCDWIVLRHRDQVSAGISTTLSNQEYLDWLDYRQDLRDMPSIVNVDTPVYPTPPTL